MKIAHALLLKENYKRLMEEMRFRLNGQLLVEEGEVIEEESRKLYERIHELMEKSYVLDACIAKTSAQTILGENYTLADLVSERNFTRKQCIFVNQTLMSLTVKGRMIARQDMSKMRPTMSAAELEKRQMMLRQYLNELEVKIQELNCQVDIIGDVDDL